MLALDEYIILDTETTGSRPLHDRIIEIGLHHIKAGKVLQTWHSFINPQTPLPTFIQQLTGITPELLTSAPTYGEVANELYKILQGKVLVAHNARFDYSFLKNEFSRFGLDYKAKTLCTVKLSRYLFPEEKKHNLGVIIERFNLQAPLRHRALADVETLQGFLTHIAQAFSETEIADATKACLIMHCLPANISSTQIKSIPNTPGVYRFYGENGALLYVGKSINLKDRILSHFAADHTSTKELRLGQQVHKIDYIETGGELGALLLEAKLIKSHQPIFNQQLRRTRTLFGFKLSKTPEGYYQIKVIPLTKILPQDIPNIYGIFKQKRQALEKLSSLVKELGLCAKLLNLEKTKSACFQHQLKVCQGACVNKIDVKEYNDKLLLALEASRLQAWPYPGPIILEEKNKASNKNLYYLVNQWCYIAHSSSRAFLEKMQLDDYVYEFELDVYRILLKHMTN
jgi:DNA polymerase-3 subunit epsilon